MIKIISHNRKAEFNYTIEQRMQVGIVLQSWEVKSIREGRINIADAYAAFDRGELFLINCHISTYSKATAFISMDCTRPRKLLLHKKELRKLYGIVHKNSQNKGGNALIPLNLHFSEKGIIKIELGLCVGKKMHDKRMSIKERDMQRSMRHDFD